MFYFFLALLKSLEKPRISHANPDLPGVKNNQLKDNLKNRTKNNNDNEESDGLWGNNSRVKRTGKDDYNNSK